MKTANILHRNHKREGRGFSKLELKELSLTLQQARGKKLRVDPLRKTIYEENIKLLKELLKSNDK